jgi:hypothetical protein
MNTAHRRLKCGAGLTEWRTHGGGATGAAAAVAAVRLGDHQTRRRPLHDHRQARELLSRRDEEDSIPGFYSALHACPDTSPSFASAHTACTHDRTQRRKEELEAKRKEQEAAAQAELSNWMQEFEGNDKPKQKFVRGGTVGGSGSGNVRGRGLQTNAPSRPMFSQDAEDDDVDGESLDGPPGLTLAPSTTRRKEGSGGSSLSSSAPSAPHRREEKKPSQMATFMEELRRKQEEREARGGDRAEVERERREALDSQDPESTNRYVGNLSPQISEERLYNQFARFGAIQVSTLSPPD